MPKPGGPTEDPTQQHPDHMVKGNLVEAIVARMHEDSDLLVHSKVKLPTRANPKRRREIDVLVTAEVLGRPMHVAFECKNYGERIGVGKIDEFAGRLEDVGIPVQYGIFVASRKGFTADALDRAKQLRMRLLMLDGLSEDRLSTAIHDAFQSIVYVSGSVTSITITNDLEEADGQALLTFIDSTGRYCGSVLDLVWAKWRDGVIPLILGEHKFRLDVPQHWRWAIPGNDIPTYAEVTIEVIGHVVTLRGKAEQLVLWDAETGMPEKVRVRANFDEVPGTLPVTTVRTEEDLTSVLKIQAISTISIGRIPLPRIRFNCYWPPSERVVLQLKRIHEDFARQRRTDIESLEGIPFDQLEIRDLSGVFEPVWPEHPAAQDEGWPWIGTFPRRRLVSRVQPTRRPKAKSKKVK